MSLSVEAMKPGTTRTTRNHAMKISNETNLINITNLTDAELEQELKRTSTRKGQATRNAGPATVTVAAFLVATEPTVK